jgi:hypothetical protein
MYYLSIAIYTLVICGLFMRWVLKNKAYSNKSSHDCEKHQMYFEADDSRGLFCSVCNITLSEEFYSTPNP